MCTCEDFAHYIRTQLTEIAEFREDEVARTGVELSSDDAVQLWIARGHAARFRIRYERGDYGARQICQATGAAKR